MNASTMSKVPSKVAVLSSASGGGAGIAARRVADALSLSDSIDVDFIDMVALGGRMPDDAAPPGNMSNRRMTDTHFTVEFPGFVRGWVIDLLQNYDVLNIHWASFLLGLSEIDELSRRGTPILFTCHDYYYFSGGCHYPASCNSLNRGCVNCPQVNTRYCSQTLIARNQRIKRRILARPNVFLAAPSQFLLNEAINSGMVPEERTVVLRNPYAITKGLDHEKHPGKTRIVLMADSITERRKAMPLALEALSLAHDTMQQRSGDEDSLLVEIIGNADASFKTALEETRFSHNLRGRISDHKEISRILNQCHVLLTCSLEDNWPNVLVEAAAHGVVPVVGPGHGCEEFVREFQTGSVAADYSPIAFRDALIAAIEGCKPDSIKGFQQQVLQAHDPYRISAEYDKTIKSILRPCPAQI